MADLIDRQAAKDAVKYIPWCDWKAVGDCLDELPAVDVMEVVHGRWEKMGEADYKCSVCGFRFTSCDPVSMFLYCRCGAKMDGERRGENAAR